ncbi:MAG TPA: hypothetical protein DEF18_08655 [Muricauda sp.]|jgi:hypothetical protein|uniref:Uncharacterized protein n=1 Tax=Flagellimonas aurea TaxID=2915619 RepID=A0ABS3G4F3_9FLAO|nr:MULTISPECIES: hypothetical protein [Allomuricauda]MAU16725.1 hypothetical protein [Allomuricauda sp.]MBC73820.1 hypothetical protein [Allomuricauda sp.]MBO0353828.1 hypothetical protein [Allomuricauda aurea]HBU78157.1 hypothetical protein [Allomuricauda sp.]|tara:strand:+ start:2631 stop:3323 length:693 start_codon:yes stop_codon:yes gene_type:complete
MRLDNKELFDFFKSLEIEVLYHANTTQTSITYLNQNGLLSRGAVESLGLNQTAQSSDDIDKVLDVWNDVFLDTTDLHTYFSRQNYYGPILFEFDVSLIENTEYEIWITKNNPIYWKKETPMEDRYFQSVAELRDNWKYYSRQKMMVTIRKNSSPILFESVRRVLVDDPRVTLTNENIHLFNETVKLIKENVPDGHILKGKFKTRECGYCWCRDNYLNQVGVPDLKRLFLS